MSDIEGSEPDWQLAAKVAASERGQRASFNAKGLHKKVRRMTDEGRTSKPCHSPCLDGLELSNVVGW